MLVEMPRGIVTAKKFPFSALAALAEFSFQTQVIAWMTEGAF